MGTRHQGYRHQVIAEYVQQRPYLIRMCQILIFWCAWLVAVFLIVGVQPLMAVIGNFVMDLVVGPGGSNWGIAAVGGDLIVFVIYIFIILPAAMK